MLGRANLNFYDVAGFKFKQDEYSNSSSSSGGSDVGGTERIRMGSVCIESVFDIMCQYKTPLPSLSPHNCFPTNFWHFILCIHVYSF